MASIMKTATLLCIIALIFAALEGCSNSGNDAGSNSAVGDGSTAPANAGCSVSAKDACFSTLSSDMEGNSGKYPKTCEVLAKFTTCLKAAGGGEGELIGACCLDIDVAPQVDRKIREHDDMRECEETTVYRGPAVNQCER